MRSGTPWSGSVTSGTALCKPILALVVPVLFLLACESPRYPEREIRFVVTIPHLPPKAAVQTASPIPPPASVPAGISTKSETPPEPVRPVKEVSREELQERWRGIEKLLLNRKLLLEDFVSVAPDAKGLPEEISTGDPKIVAQKIAGFRKKVETVLIDRKFVSEKFDRTKALINKKSLSEEKQAEMSERLGVIPRLLGDENYELANGALTFIQEELAEMEKPRVIEGIPTAPVETPTQAPSPPVPTATTPSP